ncbi:MAG TPA: enhanced serine sensitivity protein SseB C-terminal domain-containing protein [bacterium]|nr:enhanced serine sensitivity protein SseB C-terminal domain-containing protein [bacterium]
MTMTPLDQALLAAQQDPENQSLVDQFYAAFLGTALVVPIYEVPTNLPMNVPVEADGKTSLKPIVIPSGEIHYIPVFDSLQKMVQWAQEEVRYMQIEAHSFIAGLHPDIYLALNPGQELAKEFVPDEIAWLKTWTDERAKKDVLPAGTEFKFQVPKRIPHLLQSKLFGYFSKRPEIKAAYLVKFQYGKEPMGWLLVIDMASRKNQFEDVAKEIGTAVQGAMGSQVRLDIVLKKGEELDMEIAKATPPFYVRPHFH